jgi:hypothetical protein
MVLDAEKPIATEEKSQSFWEDYTLNLVRKDKIETFSPELEELPKEASKALESQ